MNLLENSPKISEIESRLAKYTFLSRNSLPGYLDGLVFLFLLQSKGKHLLMQPTQTAPRTRISITGTSSCASSRLPPSAIGLNADSTFLPTMHSRISSLHPPLPANPQL